MRLARLHRRLVIAAAFCALLAYAGGVGIAWASGWMAAGVLALAFVWQPGVAVGRRVEQFWLPLALLLVARALFLGFVLEQDLVLPVVDLLLLLLCAESLRPLETPNDARLYALVFALLLASTAYRPELIFALAFVGAALTLVPALMVGHLRREARLHDVEPPRRVTELRSSTLGAASFIVVFAVFVFVTFPRVSRDFGGREPASGTPVAGFADAVTLGAHGATIAPNPEVVLRVEFDRETPPPTNVLYWRGRSYDRFDGTRWTRTRGLRPSAPPREWYRARWPPVEIRQRVYSARLDARILPAIHPIVEVESDSNVNPLLDTSGDLLYWGSGDPVYEAISRIVPPSPDSLRRAEGRFTPGGRAFLQLPTLDSAVYRLADSLTAGVDNRYDRTVRIRDWFHDEFTYTRVLPATSREATLEHFLFQRRAGHCEYFSTAMIVLLRAAGIEAREVNGFLGGEWNAFGSYLVVTQNQAHSWVEVWFPGFGWVPFDPTPSTIAAGEVLSPFRWPGLFFLDGLRHRWKKWVLDYGPERQSALFERLRGEGRPEPQPEDGPRRTLPSWTRLLAAALGLTALFWGWGMVQRRVRLRPESRSFEHLRQSYERAGIEGAADAGPLALALHLTTAGAPHAAEATELLSLYVRLRFAGSAAPQDVRHLQRGVRRVVRALRAHRLRRLLRATPG